MRKYVLIALAIVSYFLVIVWALQPEPAKCDGALHRVTRGESISTITSMHCSSGVRTATDQLVDQYGAAIEPGQVLQLP